MMNHFCVLKAHCVDGEIQIVVASQTDGVVSNLKEMSQVVSIDCTLQSKVTELLRCINGPLSKVERKDMLDSRDEIKLEVEHGESVFVDDKDVILYEPVGENEFDNDDLTPYIVDMSEFVNGNDDDDDDDIRNESNYNCEKDVDPALLKKFVMENYTNNRSNTKYSGELDSLLPDKYLHGVQSKMLKDIESENPFKCGLCDENFATHAGIRNHLREVHPKNDIKKVFGCKYCNKFFTQSCIIHHLSVHKKPYKCPHCDKGFSHQGNLKRHLLYVNGIYKHTCSVCGFQCVAVHELRSHMITHEDASQLVHQCPTCGKIFARTSQLNRHVATHNESRAYCCDICNKTYTTYYYLRIHERTHKTDRQRKFSCLFCDKAYFKKESLVKHVLTHHH